MTLLKQLTRDAYRRGRATPTGRTMLGAAAMAREPLDYYRRRRAAVRYNERFPSSRMPDAKGYALLPAGSLPGTSGVIDTCRRLFIDKKAALDAKVPTSPKAIRRLQKSKRSFLRDLLNDDDLRANPDLIDFALSDPLLSIVTSYFGVVPNLNRIDLVYSVPRLTPDEHIHSQLFHQDPEGLRQAKVFLNVFDVEAADGPFTFLPAAESERVVTAIRQQRRKTGAPWEYRYRDEALRAHTDLDAAIRLTGPAGTAVVVDTSRCMHAGSRLWPGHFRLCLFLQYCTSHENANTFDARRFRKDPVRWLALRRFAAPD